MPGARSPVKSTGDIHPPEVEDTVPGRPDDADPDDTPRESDRGRAGDLARETEDEARPGQGENQAGFLKDRDGSLRGRDES